MPCKLIFGFCLSRSSSRRSMDHKQQLAVRSWPAHFREVTQLLLSQDETFLVSGSADASVGSCSDPFGMKWQL